MCLHERHETVCRCVIFHSPTFMWSWLVCRPIAIANHTNQNVKNKKFVPPTPSDTEVYPKKGKSSKLISLLMVKSHIPWRVRDSNRRSRCLRSSCNQSRKKTRHTLNFPDGLPMNDSGEGLQVKKIVYMYIKIRYSYLYKRVLLLFYHLLYHCDAATVTFRNFIEVVDTRYFFLFFAHLVKDWSTHPLFPIKIYAEKQTRETIEKQDWVYWCIQEREREHVRSDPDQW